MRLGVVWSRSNNAHYRAVGPMEAMERRGHDVVWPGDKEGRADPRRLAGCDVVHVYRRADEETCRAIRQLASRGIAITWDNDDDYTAVPKEAPTYKVAGGLAGRRLFSEQLKMARMAYVVTTPSDSLAEKYRRAGIEPVEVIGNYLAPDAFRPRRSHDGIVVGWVAGLEHQADLARIGIVDALRRLIAEHSDVRVESIGVNLGLTERYRHDRFVPFEELPGRIGGFDIGIAPLADMPLNVSRSDIKLKEYAASGVPWLASPVGPYLGLGEREGGRLVRDDDWFEALARLVTRRRERRRLARRAKAWAKGQTIAAASDRWERLFTDAKRSVNGSS